MITYIIGFFLIQAQAQTARNEATRLLSHANYRCQNSSRPKLNIAHRGNESEYLENTPAAFASAGELGADMVELDVVLTKDDKVLVYHDAKFNRSLISCGAFQGEHVRNLSLEQIQTNCRFKTERLFTPKRANASLPDALLANTDIENDRPPTLSDVIKLMQPSNTGLLVELKTFSQQQEGVQKPVTKESSLAVLDSLAELDPNDGCLSENPPRALLNRTYQCFRKINFMSFDTGLMDFISQKIQNDPRYQRLYRAELLKLVYPSPQYGERLLQKEYANQYWNLDGVAFRFHLGADGGWDEAELNRYLQKMNCENDFSKGKRKFVWTASTKDEIDKLRNKAVNGIINARPYDLISGQPTARGRGGRR